MASGSQKADEKGMGMGLMHSESAQILQMMNSSPTGMLANEDGENKKDEQMNLPGGFQLASFLGAQSSLMGGMPDPGNLLMLKGPGHRACFADLPHSVSQSKIFMLFNSRELFTLR